MMAAVMLIIGAAFAAGTVPENGEKLFARFEGMEWTFSSGAGGWSTDLQIQPDGTFTGVFHDSEMGETADEYPDGTVYYCEFSGKFSAAAQEDGNTWKLHVDELKQKDETDKETIEDGIRFVATSSYGIELEDELMLYQPGPRWKPLPNRCVSGPTPLGQRHRIQLRCRNGLCTAKSWMPGLSVT